MRIGSKIAKQTHQISSKQKKKSLKGTPKQPNTCYKQMRKKKSSPNNYIISRLSCNWHRQRLILYLIGVGASFKFSLPCLTIPVPIMAKPTSSPPLNTPSTWVFICFSAEAIVCFSAVFDFGVFLFFFSFFSLLSFICGSDVFKIDLA